MPRSTIKDAVKLFRQLTYGYCAGRLYPDHYGYQCPQQGARPDRHRGGNHQSDEPRLAVLPRLLSISPSQNNFPERDKRVRGGSQELSGGVKPTSRYSTNGKFSLVMLLPEQMPDPKVVDFLKKHHVLTLATGGEPALVCQLFLCFCRGRDGFCLYWAKRRAISARWG